MAHTRTSAAFLGAVLLLVGCTYAGDPVWPAAAAEKTTPDKGEAAPAAPGQVAAVQPPASSDDQSPGVTPGKPTGTFVGQKVEELRGDLARLQESIAKHNAELQQVRAHMIEHSQAYHATVAAIEARLQVGTTPGNPVLVQQWNESQQQLSAFNGDLSALNNLTTTVGGDATMANYLVGSVRAAFGLSGAVEADHEQLTTLEDETNRTEVLIERLMTELTDDLNRQTNYLAAERANLSTLALAIQNGESLGPALTTRSRTALTQVAEANAAAAPTVSYQQPAMIGGRKPLVVIRFDRPNVNYDQALYNAVSRALERKPQAMFDLVAVAAAASGGAEGQANSVAARRYADQVLRALSEMGLPANRVTLSGATDATSHFNQVQIYVR